MPPTLPSRGGAVHGLRGHCPLEPHRRPTCPGHWAFIGCCSFHPGQEQTCVTFLKACQSHVHPGSAAAPPPSDTDMGPGDHRSPQTRAGRGCGRCEGGHGQARCSWCTGSCLQASVECEPESWKMSPGWEEGRGADRTARPQGPRPPMGSGLRGTKQGFGLLAHVHGEEGLTTDRARPQRWLCCLLNVCFVA